MRVIADALLYAQAARPSRIDKRLLRLVTRNPLRPLTSDSFVNLFSMDGDVFRRVDPQSNLTSLDGEHRHGDLIADHDRCANASR